jgi:glycosyltransferase involved in cell wall biosynthesis
MPKKRTLSVCMIVRNEEENLPRALASVKDLADEIIVVDTGSTDRTIAIARDAGAKVHHFEWCDDFSAARNESIQHATKHFILWMDADDEIERQDHAVIKAHLRQNPGSTVFLKLVSIWENETTEALQLRIFPNLKGLRFAGKIHEQISIALQDKGMNATICNARVTHFGYHSRAALAEKLERNRAIHEQELREEPDNFYSLFFLGRTLKGLGEMDKALEYMVRVLKAGESKPDRDTVMITALDAADILLSQGKIRQAVSMLEYWRTPLKSPALLDFRLGELYFKMKDYDNAYNTLSPLKSHGFDNEFVPVNVRKTRLNLLKYLGVSALFSGDLPLADRCFTESREADGENVETYHFLSLARENASDLEGAIRVCHEGLERLGDNSYLRKRLFLLFLAKNDLEGALMEYSDLKGFKDDDLDVVSGMFLIACRRLNMEEINRYYALIRSGLSLPVSAFPDGLDGVREVFPTHRELKASELFESGISHLLKVSA